MKSVLTVILVGLLISACDLTEERDRSYTGDARLEFFPQSDEIEEGANGVTTDIQLIGPQQDSDLQVDFVVIDSARSGATQAEEGVHYEIESSSATIETGTSSAEVAINVLDNDLDDGDVEYDLLLEIQESDGIEPAENLKVYTLTIEGQDE